MTDRRTDLNRRAAAAARMEAATSREAFHMITRGRARGDVETRDEDDLSDRASTKVREKTGPYL